MRKVRSQTTRTPPLLSAKNEWRCGTISPSLTLPVRLSARMRSQDRRRTHPRLFSWVLCALGVSVVALLAVFFASLRLCENLLLPALRSLRRVRLHEREQVGDFLLAQQVEQLLRHHRHQRGELLIDVLLAQRHL